MESRKESVDRLRRILDGSYSLLVVSVRTTKEGPNMKRLGLVALSCVVLLASASYAAPQVAGSTRVGSTVGERRAVADGWRAKKQILRQPVYDEQTQKVGTVAGLMSDPGTSGLL